MKGVVVSVFVVLAVVVMVEQGQAAISCGQVDASLLPCINYLTGRDTKPSAPCCTGVTTIKSMTTTSQDKRDACNCVKSAANRYPNLKDDAAVALPKACGVTLDIPISRTTNCDALF